MRVDGGLVSELYIVRNPEKLTRIEGEAAILER